jgi:ubiquinone/menaquinone biosynthesis C-methylase UbiE
MKTEWDYTSLADAYLKRPDYSDDALDEMLRKASLSKGAVACDVGAGVAHLTIKLAGRGLTVFAVEPNDAMRANGIARTKQFVNVSWSEGTGEATGQPSAKFDIVTFGSSFNVTDRQAALRESARILRKNGWFACMWNHRDLDDPIQSGIEDVIKSQIAEYAYGTRREDQTGVILASGLTKKVEKIEGRVFHRQTVEDCIEAWRSHATLHRQAGDRFPEIIRRIEELLAETGKKEIFVPFTTRIWLAQINQS